MQPIKPSARLPLVLVIDDDQTIRMLLGIVIKQLGYSALEVSSGAEGITAAIASQPDLILLDVMMPGMDGFETCRALRADPRTDSIPVMMLTGLDDDGAVQQALDAGANYFVNKPINLALVSGRIREALMIVNA
jgi:CheY-like chemotaxis protein